MYCFVYLFLFHIITTEIHIYIYIKLCSPRPSEDKPQKRKSCTWMAEELITAGALVLLVMAMMDLVGAGMEVVIGKHARQGEKGFVACRELPEHFLSAK